MCLSVGPVIQEHSLRSIRLSSKLCVQSANWAATSSGPSRSHGWGRFSGSSRLAPVWFKPLPPESQSLRPNSSSPVVSIQSRPGIPLRDVLVRRVLVDRRGSAKARCSLDLLHGHLEPIARWRNAAICPRVTQYPSGQNMSFTGGLQPSVTSAVLQPVNIPLKHRPIVIAKQNHHRHNRYSPRARTKQPTRAAPVSLIPIRTKHAHSPADYNPASPQPSPNRSISPIKHRPIVINEQGHRHRRRC